MQTPEVPVRPKRILVVGGGPAGLVTLRNFIDLGTFERVELVERRDDVGGVWYLDQGLNGQLDHNNGKAPRFPSPAYPGLIGNVLPEFLSYHGFPFPPPSEYDKENREHQPFPTLTETHEYLRAFAKPYVEDGRIRLGKEVVRVEERVVDVPEDIDETQKGYLRTKNKWRVVLKDWADTAQPGKELEEFWDAVAVCNGWYDNLSWPETDGLEEVKEKGFAKHAKWWRGPEGWEGKRILVIGNANSSNDIAAQLAPYASPSSPVYRSKRRPNFPTFVSLPDERIEDVPAVKQYSLYTTTTNQQKVRVELEGGRIIQDIDVVWVGTGYKPSVPFVHVLPPSFEPLSALDPKSAVPLMSLTRFNLPSIDDDEVSDVSVDVNGSVPSTTTNPATTKSISSSSLQRVPLLHRHLLYAPSPSLSFILTTMAFTPFTIADLGSLWVGLVWTEGSGITYPATLEERLEFERKRIEGIERGRREAARVDAATKTTTETVTDTRETVKTKEDENEPNGQLAEAHQTNGVNGSKAEHQDQEQDQCQLQGTSSQSFSPPPSLISAWTRGINGHTPSALNSYSVLGRFEEEYASKLREEVVRAKEELGRPWVGWTEDSTSNTSSSTSIYRTTISGLPEWNPERTKKREAMYPVKLASLKWAREKGGKGWTNRE